MINDNLRKILNRLDAMDARISKIERDTSVVPVQSVATGSSKKVSPREFILTKKPADDVKRTLVVGYFLEKFENCTTFNISDLEAAFERAKEKKPSNMNDKVNMNIRNGHLEEASEKKDSRKAWYLTNTGEKMVEEGFTLAK